ncbi:MAG: TonB-dependent receptor [Acidobacteria bacterium]|nr:TonB-dependent receptor [Acidobacteriota bacterium]
MESSLKPSRERCAARRLAFFLLLPGLLAQPLSAQGQADAGEPAGTPQAESGKPTADQSEQKKQLPTFVEKVVVSATVAEERRDPASVTTLGREEIATRNRGQDTAMLLAETPNAYAYSDAGNGVGYAYFSLRGFDQRRIAVYVNGVPLNDPESQQVYFIDLADLAGGLSAIQVQRGTGTALYGSPHVGGVVNLETGAEPTERGGTLVLGGGSFGTYRLQAQYAWPLGGGRSTLSARVAHVRSDGYRQPAWTRHSLADLGFQRIGGASVLRVKFLGGPEKTQLAYLGVPIRYLRGEITGDADRDRRKNPLHRGETDSFLQPQLQVLHDWRLRERLLLENTLYSIFGDGHFRQYRAQYDYDPLGPAPATPDFPELTIQDAWRERSLALRQYGWIPSLAWEHPHGRLVGGLELRHASGRHFGSVVEGARCTVPGGDDSCVQPGSRLEAPLPAYDFTNHKTTLSAFLRETFQPGAGVSLNFELQATRHRFSMDEDEVRGYSWDTDYSFVTPRVGVNWNATERVNLYASFSTARSEPRFEDVWDPQDVFANPVSLFAAHDPAVRHFSDANARLERLRAVETGAGYRSRRARLKANFYWMDFRDELVYAGGIDEDGLPVTDNAARSLHRGVEIEGALELPGRVDLTGWLAASDDVLEDYVLKFGPTSADQVDYSANRIALFPTHQARLGVSRTFGALRASFGLRHVGTIYLDNSQNERKDPAARQAAGYVNKTIDPFTVAELQARLDLGRLFRSSGRSAALVVHVDNVFDERYAASGYAYGEPYFFPGATRNVSVGLSLGFR